MYINIYVDNMEFFGAVFVFEYSYNLSEPLKYLLYGIYLTILADIWVTTWHIFVSFILESPDDRRSIANSTGYRY